MKRANKWMTAVAAGLVALGGSVVMAQDKPAEGEQPRRGALAGPRARDENRQRPERVEGERGPRGPQVEPGQVVENLTGILRELNLTEDQKVRTKEIFEAAREEMQAFRQANGEELQELRKAMREAVEARDRDKAREIGEQVRTLMEQGPKPGALVQKIKNVLNDEQKKIFEEKLAELRDKARGRMEERRGDGERPRPRLEQGDGERPGPRPRPRDGGEDAPRPRPRPQP